MNIRMDQLIRAIAVALDIVEGELLGASTHHGKRIAALSAAMGRYFGMDEAFLTSLATCALFHDSALTEYILSEQRANDPAMKLHCEYGQRNAEAFLLNRDVAGFVLYHHERADGSGPFGKKDGEFPLGAEIIAIADMLDVTHHLQTISPRALADVRKRITEEAGSRYTKRAAEAMLAVLDEDMLALLRDDCIRDTVERIIPPWPVDIEDLSVFRIADLAARIIDYKSVFTRRHSVQVANKAWLMGEYYGYDRLSATRLYLSAALHDLGKLATPSHILEKQGKLTDAEFATIKDHVRLTQEILKDVSGFERVCAIAAGHHEKLDGTGYHAGKTADEISFDERIVACLDIYQAVSEPRPYHDGRSHAETMPILCDMAQKGFIDKRIVEDLDTVMAAYSGTDAPLPACFAP
ncbi:MAG: HD domain-containing protein [Clostridiales Family XIII bacterium]|jgi:HD-GYP domain-containing protein (c-di-GMP phosphodiesterase class II)|nr:HD domain-containing protein [Clostridiales Family XIII bacterium]